MNNPLLSKQHLPAFDQIKPEHIEPAVDHVLAENRQQIAKLLHQKNFSWENLIQPFEEINDRLTFMWSVIVHLNAVVNSKSLRQAYDACLPKITKFNTEVAHNQALFAAIQSIAHGNTFQQLDAVQQKIINEELRDFHLAGIDLPPEKKYRFSELQQALSAAVNLFQQNVLDATQAWSYHTTDKKDLTGIPELALQAAEEAAKQKNLTGWLFTLEAPSYLPVITYADSRALREKFYQAYVTRASDQGPHAGQWDNSAVMKDILKIRRELALLLDFKNYAEYSLATKTAKSTDEVLNFLNQLVENALPIARKEYAELSQFAKENFNLPTVQAWDIPYVSEKLQQKKYVIFEEELRPYFPVDQVLTGLFGVVNRLYGIQVKEKFNIPTWHPDVRFFEIYDAQNNLRGQFYLDLYARANKRSGAWMDECRDRRLLPNGQLQLPVAFLTCNFSRPAGDKPALFTHEEVLTLFHEFGHGLHQMLSQVNYPEASGINHFPWDVVEFPSQFHENWCWQKPAIDLFTKHYQTGEVLPAELLSKLQKTKIFQVGLKAARQLEFALFDFLLHIEFDPQQKQQIQNILDKVRAQLSLYPVPAYNRFQHAFTHVFGSGYAAGYYSYKWAEVWASDAFAKFEEQGIFNREVGEQFLHAILEKGNSQDPLKMFIEFRGRPPSIDALLRHMMEHASDSMEGQPPTIFH